MVVYCDSHQIREWIDETSSPESQGWLDDTINFTQRATSKTSFLYPVPSEHKFPPSPPPTPSLHLPHVSLVPSVRHRTPQACDKCRERKTKCSGNRPICGRCHSRGLTCNYSTRETRIRRFLKSRDLAHTFDRPLISDEKKAALCGRPTPAHHSRMGLRQTTAFAMSPGVKAPSVTSTIPVYTTVPVSLGRQEPDFSRFQDIVPPVPFSLCCSAVPRSSEDSADRTRKTSLPLLDHPNYLNGKFSLPYSLFMNQGLAFDNQSSDYVDQEPASNANLGDCTLQLPTTGLFASDEDPFALRRHHNRLSEIFC